MEPNTWGKDPYWPALGQYFQIQKYSTHDNETTVTKPNVDMGIFSKANICFITEVKTKVFTLNKGSIHQLSDCGNEADVTIWNNRLVRSTMLVKS